MQPQFFSHAGRKLIPTPWPAVVVAVTAFLLTSSMFASLAKGDSPVTDLPKVEGIAIDQRVTDWKDQGLVIHAMAGDSILLRKSDDFEVAARLGWNEHGVLLHVDVTDSSPWEEASIDKLFQGDSVELYLMSSQKADGMIQVVASPGRTRESPKPRVKLFDYRSRFIKAHAAVVQPLVSVQKRDKGYTMDLLVPWSSMKIAPEAGSIVNLSFAVNDSDGTERQRAIWIDHEAVAQWMALSPVRLAEKTSGASPIAVWGGYDEMKSVYVNAVADPELAGKTLSVLSGSDRLAQVPLLVDGGRAVARIRMPFPSLGQTLGDLRVQLDRETVQTLTLPDAVALRKQQFLSGQGSMWSAPPAWLVPRCAPEVFAGSEFPVGQYPEPQRIVELAGSYTLDTVYYDGRFQRVSRPGGPGRYGAVTTSISAAGDAFNLYQTLYCRRQGAAQLPAGTSARLLAAREQNANAGELDALKLDVEWWHALRKQLGTATRYEYFVRLPRGYDEDPAKRWPVIFFLHGSGGGDNPQNVRDGGVQAAARQSTDFPFIAVSLRSPGGWEPPG